MALLQKILTGLKFKGAENTYFQTLICAENTYLCYGLGFKNYNLYHVLSIYSPLLSSHKRQIQSVSLCILNKDLTISERQTPCKTTCKCHKMEYNIFTLQQLMGLKHKVDNEIIRRKMFTYMYLCMHKFITIEHMHIKNKIM